MKRKLYYALIIVFALVFVVSTAGAGMTLYEYYQADKEYGDLQNRYIGKPSNETGDKNEGDNSKPSGETAPISVDFEALLKENSDVIGWLFCENTPINYPVVQTKDNDYYLRRDLNGKYLRTGTLFADFRCSAVGTGQNHIIYGHNMKNSSMFGTLLNYGKQEYYAAHPVLYYLTPNNDYKIELFSGFTANSNSNIYRTEIGNAEEFEAFLKEITAKSTFTSNVSVGKDDRIVMLSTCSYEFNNARYVVFGKLTPLNTQE